MKDQTVSQDPSTSAATRTSGVAVVVARWVTLLAFIALGFVYLNSAAFSAWVAGGPPTTVRDVWLHRTFAHLCYAVGAVLGGVVLFRCIRRPRSFRPRVGRARGSSATRGRGAAHPLLPARGPLPRCRRPARCCDVQVREVARRARADGDLREKPSPGLPCLGGECGGCCSVGFGGVLLTASHLSRVRRRVSGLVLARLALRATFDSHRGASLVGVLLASRAVALGSHQDLQCRRYR